MVEWHPLINQEDSPHYDREDGKVAIEEMEKVMNIREMIGFCRGNLFKYDWRLGDKDSEDVERRKIKTYQNYRAVLYRLLQQGIEERLSVARAFEIAGVQWRYR
jgi:hypothetical protein